MSISITAVLAVLAGYLIGSLDFAVVVARIHGVDIRQVGSGNPGTANVLRTLGKGPAAMVLVGDMMKGVIAAAMGMVVDGSLVGPWAFTVGLAAVVGHCYPVFHRFRGGKGVATGFGVVLFTIPLAAVVMAALWLSVVGITRISALGSMAMALVAVPLGWWRGLDTIELILLGAMFALVIWRHRGNLRRLLSGEEQTVTGT